MDDYLATPNILDRMQKERDALFSRVQAISADLRDKRPDSTSWSIAEVLEHLMRVEIGVTKLLTVRGHDAPPADTPHPDPSSFLTPEISAIARDRNRGIEAPERVRPSGTLSSQDALAQLASTRAGLLSAFSSANPEALNRLTHPHPVFGPLTLRSWVAFSADHEARHADQIADIARRLC
jgi:uncharacterized damage-inducible protein DinB